MQKEVKQANIYTTDVSEVMAYRPKKSVWKDIWSFRHIYLFLLPAIIWYIIFCYVPMYGLILAFKDFNFGAGMIRSPWVGLRYFYSFMKDPDFYIVIKNTLSITVLKLIFGFPAPIVLALMLNEVRNRAFKRTVQTVSYLPHFISWVVVVALMTKFLSPTNGMINDIRVAMGEKPIFFMGLPNLFYPLVVISDIWKEIGWGSIIYLAAITNIDPTLYEAAEIDGAGRWGKMIHVTLPCIKPTIGILLIMSLGGLFNAGFDQIYLMQTPSTQSVSEILDTYVLKRGLKMGQFGYSTAVGMFQSIISLILVVTVNNISRRMTEISLW